jgi:hypothetical protein
MNQIGDNMGFFRSSGKNQQLENLHNGTPNK